MVLKIFSPASLNPPSVLAQSTVPKPPLVFIHCSPLLPLVVLVSHLLLPFQVAHSVFFSPSSHSLSVVLFLSLLVSSFLACVRLLLSFLSPSHLSPLFYTSFQTLKNTSKNGKTFLVRCFSSIQCLVCSSVFPNSLVWFLSLPPPLHLDYWSVPPCRFFHFYSPPA